MTEPAKIAAIILAAGKSERMRYPKPLLIFGKETAVDRVIRVCREAGCDPVIVVLGHEEGRVRENASLAGAEIVVNAAFETGRSSSLQVGLKALPRGTAAFLLFPVDHTLVDGQTVASLIEAYRETGDPIVLPVCGEKRGHPVLCDGSLIPEFLSLAPDAPARVVTGADPSRVRGVDTEDEEVLRDLDTPADYQSALEIYSARGGEAGFLAPKGAGRPAPKRPPV